MEIRLHGRGGQGGVTGAKILAALYTELGKNVQAFGDYAGERSGAPVRAYVRVSDAAIIDRNKVYDPDHLVVLDASLLAEATVAGLRPGGVLLVNTHEPPQLLASRFPGFRAAAVDATAIARAHSIGSRSLVIVNTTIAGAFARVLGLPIEALQKAYRRMGLDGDLGAAEAAAGSVRVVDPTSEQGGGSLPLAPPRTPPRSGGQSPPPLARATHAGESSRRPTNPGGGSRREAAGAGAGEAAASPWGQTALGPVLDLVDHVEGSAPLLKTGAWRSQQPRFVRRAAPCTAVCPAGNDVVGFVQALAREGETAAAEILGQTSPLAAVCGRVCPAFCQQSCIRRDHDGSVQVREIERWIADHTPVARRARSRPERRHRIAVVGGGPAGLSAAYVLARAGHDPVIFEGESKLGGVLHTGIPSYRLPRKILAREIEGILSLGVDVRSGLFLDRPRLAALPHEFDAVILAMGLQRPTSLDVPGVDLGGIEQGVRFLHRVNVEGGAAVSGHVVVLGGGNTAMDCARSAMRLGAEQVTVVYRRTPVEMPAIQDEVDEAREEGVRFLFQRAPVGFAGAGRVGAIRLAEVEMGPPDAALRRRPVMTDRIERLACDQVLLALGQSVDEGALPAGWTIENGHVHDRGKPARVFAAGDLATNDGTVTHAIGDGRRAADAVLRALGDGAPAPRRLELAAAVKATDVRFHHFPRLRPARGRHEDAAARIAHFREVNHGIADPSEAGRCLSCGFCSHCDTCLVYCPDGIIHRKGDDYEIDGDFCKGCGVCVTECPRGAMEIVLG